MITNQTNSEINSTKDDVKVRLNRTDETETLGEKFLLAEFNELGEFWRQTDSRIEQAINFYITSLAILIPGSILVYQSNLDTKLFVGAMLLISIFFIMMGYFLIARITSADTHKAGYTLGLNLIRRYFVDRDSSIASYLYLPTVEPLQGSKDRIYKLKPYFHAQIVWVISIINSFLFGGVFLVAIRIFTGKTFGGIIESMLFLLGFIFSLSLHLFWYRRRIKPYKGSTGE